MAIIALTRKLLVIICEYLCYLLENLSGGGEGLPSRWIFLPTISTQTHRDIPDLTRHYSNERRFVCW